MSLVDRSYTAGFREALTKISGMTLAQLTKTLDAPDIENELLPTMRRNLRGTHEAPPVVWSQKVSPEAQNNGGADMGRMPASGAV